MVALSRIRRDFHLAQKRVHLLARELPAGTNRALAGHGRSDVLEAHFDQMERQIDGLRSVTTAVASEQEALARLLRYGPGHNEALRLGTNGDFAQVLNDFVLCGLPGGGDQPGDPVNSCSGR